MGTRFAGKYDVLDQEVKLGLQILSAVEAASGRRVQIYCLPLSALQIDLPCPPEFIERRFRSAVTLEGQVIEADVDPETENAYVVAAAPGASKNAGFAAPTMEFNAWRASAAHQSPNDETLAPPTTERPAWPAESATNVDPQLRSPSSSEPAVSFTKLFGEAPSGSEGAAVNSPARSYPPATAVESGPLAKKPMESFTAFFKVGSSASSRTPEPKPEPFAPRIDPVPPPAPPQAGGFTAFFGSSKSSPASPEPLPSPFAAPAPSTAFGSTESPSSPGAFTQLFGGAAASAEAKEIGGVPHAQFTPSGPKNPAGSFTAMFSNEPPSSMAPTTEPNFATPQPAKAPGAFTELFRRMPDPQASSSPLTAEPAAAPPTATPRPRSDGFTAIFGTPGAAPAEPGLPTMSTPPPANAVPSPDLTPRLDRPGTATQSGASGGAVISQPQAAPAASRPSQYTMVRKGWTAPPPPSVPGVPAPSGSATAPQMPGVVPAPQWPSAPAMPTMPTAPQMPMATPQVAAAQPQAPAYPGFQPPAAPAWPPQAVPPQPAMPTPPPMAAAQAQTKAKPSYLPLIIILNALFLLAVVIVLIFVLTKH